MSDYDKNGASLIRYQSAPLAAQTSAPSPPSLPSSSGVWLATRNAILKKDTRFVELHTDYLNARRAQSDAMTGLVESRIKAALTMAKLTALPEIADHEYRLGRLDRDHEMRMRGLSHQCNETAAEAALLEAQQRLGRLMPEPAKSPSPSPPAGLTAADVEKVAQAMPELTPQTIQSLVWALGGLLAEKNT